MTSRNIVFHRWDLNRLLAEKKCRVRKSLESYLSLIVLLASLLLRDPERGEPQDTKEKTPGLTAVAWRGQSFLEVHAFLQKQQSIHVPWQKFHKRPQRPQKKLMLTRILRLTRFLSFINSQAKASKSWDSGSPVFRQGRGDGSDWSSVKRTNSQTLSLLATTCCPHNV